MRVIEAIERELGARAKERAGDGGLRVLDRGKRFGGMTAIEKGLSFRESVHRVIIRRCILDAATRCLLGGGLGDALGYPVEFVGTGAAIIASFGAYAPARLLRCPDGAVHVSDDTQMTLFTAEGLALATQTGDPAIDSVHAAYQRWLYTQMPDRFDCPDIGWLVREDVMLARRAPGQTCMTALVDNVRNARIPTLKTPPNDSKGCGAIMRSAPFAFVVKTRGEAFVLARDAAVLTHGHPSGYLSAAYFASVVFDLARGASLDEALDAASALLEGEHGHDETSNAVRTARAMTSSPSIAAIEALPNGGWTGEWALAIAIACVRDVDEADESAVANALWRAAARGGDSDSTASLAGNLLGARAHTRLPRAWLDELEMRDVIERAARDLVPT